MPIKVNNVFYTYSKKTPNSFDAIKGISLNIEDNDFIAVIGATGSGKSTLIQHLNGLLIPDKGEIVVNNHTITSNPRKNKNIKSLRKEVGVVFQFPEYQLFEDTIEKDVAFGPRNFGDSQEVALFKARKALKMVGIKEEYFTRSPFELSGGEKRRVAIAGILAINPSILVLDEPTAGLDPTGTEDIMNLICELHKQGKTIVLVTHDMDLVLKYATKVIVLKDGEITYQGTPNKLFECVSEDSSIEVPTLYKVVNYLNEHNFHINLEGIKDINSLVDIIKEKVENHG